MRRIAGPARLSGMNFTQAENFFCTCHQGLFNRFIRTVIVPGRGEKPGSRRLVVA